MTKALVVIDIQNDYFADGRLPLWNTEEILTKAEEAIGKARAQGIPVILVQHVIENKENTAPFFGEGTHGVAIHPRILSAAGPAPVVTKSFADSFHQTTLESFLSETGADELILCGMMTHNCITHTALSPAAAKYQVSILADACTTVSELMHVLALHALEVRVPLQTVSEAF